MKKNILVFANLLLQIISMQAQPHKNSVVTYSELTQQTFQDGIYYCSQKNVKYIEISNCCEGKELKAKYIFRNLGQSYDPILINFKKDSIQTFLYRAAPHNLYLLHDEGIMVLFNSDYSKEIKVLGSSLTIISMDKNVKQVDPQKILNKIEELVKNRNEAVNLMNANSQKKKIDERKLPKEGMVNPELQAEIFKALKGREQRESWKEQFIKVYIISKDWEIKRDKFTGVILSRYLTGVGIANYPDGHCIYQLFDFEQKYDGINYQKTLYCNGIGDQHTINCNNTK